MSTFRMIAAVSSLLLATTPALAASDYLLQLDPVQGQGQDAAPQSIEVESFSWGTSNAGSMATGGGSGKVNVQDISLTKRGAPRDASSGMASGKRAAPDAVADVQPVAAAAVPSVGDVASFTVLIRESPTKASTGKTGACAKGTHFPHAVLVARGQRYEFSDLVETTCTVADGQVKKNYTGHVTLMK
jgi:type VI secretion system secreted protein Hcp